MVFYILASPIGNLKDISINFLETVSKINYLVSEDTRQTAKLLQLLQQDYPNYSLWPKHLLRSDQYSEHQVTEQILNLLKNESVGLLTDAGMPAVSDPGAFLIKTVKDEGFALEILPGPSALTAAMSLCGYEACFTWFVGFWPKKSQSLLKSINKVIETNQKSSLNLVFFESPLRIHKTCHLLASKFPQAQFFIGRELTKKFQTLIWFQAKDIDKQVFKPKGEYSVVINLK